MEIKSYTGITAQNVDPARLEKAFQLGQRLATHLKTLGAAEIIAAAKKIVDQPMILVPESSVQQPLQQRNGTPVPS